MVHCAVLTLLLVVTVQQKHSRVCIKYMTPYLIASTGGGVNDESWVRTGRPSVRPGGSKSKVEPFQCQSLNELGPYNNNTVSKATGDMNHGPLQWYRYPCAPMLSGDPRQTSWNLNYSTKNFFLRSRRIAKISLSCLACFYFSNEVAIKKVNIEVFNL